MARKAKKEDSQTWFTHMRSVKQQHYEAGDFNFDEIKNLLNPAHQNRVFHHSIPLMYLLDYTSRKYILMSRSSRVVTGFRPDDFLEGGIDFFLYIYQKNHLRLFNEEIFPDRLQFLKTVPAAEHKNYIFSYNYQIRDASGGCCNLLQRSSFLQSDDAGNPLLSFGMVINVDHYKNENPVIQLVEQLTDTPDGPMVKLLDKKVFYLDTNPLLFSSREREVLLWIADGLTSKEIAEKLFISEHTVINHRRHMQAKCNMPNTSALISFAIRKGII